MILSPERVTFDRITEIVYQGTRISTLDDYHRPRAHDPLPRRPVEDVDGRRARREVLPPAPR